MKDMVSIVNNILNGSFLMRNNVRYNRSYFIV